MRSRIRRIGLWTLGVVAVFAVVLVVLGLVGRRATSREPVPAVLGKPGSSDQMEAALAEPGPIELETVLAADWAVDLSGLLDLDDPTARDAGLEDRLEPIHLYFYALRHPEHGLFIIDTGVERAFVADPERSALRGILRRFIGAELFDIHIDTATWIAKQDVPLAGVFVTHLHLDHVMGLPDVPASTPIYIGPGEATARAGLNFATTPTVDRALGDLPLHELSLPPDPSGRFEGLLDVFGDGSLWAIHVPGHTPGSTAFVARTTKGPVLFTGDASHTRWGWDNDVPPGYFTADADRGRDSFRRLRALVADHPEIDVRVGHQP
jgi:N-acyl homoserine lactone hydrolase